MSDTEQPTPRPVPRAEPVGHQGARVDITQRPALAITGWAGVVVLIALGWWSYSAVKASSGWTWLPILMFVLVATSLVVVAPGQSYVVQFFGTYVGTVRKPGFWWVLPLTIRRRVSIRVRNFETNRLKVNDSDGNPVDIAAIVVWQVADTARSSYAVDNYENFVSVQAESALRHVANTHPYDNAEETGASLRGATDVVAAELAHEVAERVSIAGVEIVEVRISHLAYAQEIAQAMLRRQQANAVVAARSRIVEGAVGMVEMALNRLSEGQVVDLDEERKASMVSNLMVVLCGDQPPTPVVNTGSLYS
ncbi:SPFH domain-containing protein [Oryzihumus sp.]|uniref:SPFH domain-containing protein n=1 Tax=Oryzihumus sp. TaxID=1968903 RepID=UPI002ED77BFA